MVIFINSSDILEHLCAGDSIITLRDTVFAFMDFISFEIIAIKTDIKQ